MDAMLEEISSADLARWEAFYRLEPWGTDVEDNRAGVLAATVAEFAGRKLKDGARLAPSDAFPSRLELARRAREGGDPEAQLDALFDRLSARATKGTADGNE